MKDKLKAKLAALWAKSRAVGMSVAVAASLTFPAFAGSEGGAGGASSSTGMAAVTAAADTVVTFVGKAFDLITGNPLTAVYLASGLIGVGLHKFISMRRAAH